MMLIGFCIGVFFCVAINWSLNRVNERTHEPRAVKLLDAPKDELALKMFELEKEAVISAAKADIARVRAQFMRITHLCRENNCECIRRNA